MLSNKRNHDNQLFLCISFCILVFSLVINENKYGVTIGDIEIAFVLSFLFYTISCFMLPKTHVDLFNVIIIVLFFLLSVLSTFLSNVVTLNKDFLGFFISIFTFVFFRIKVMEKSTLKTIINFYILTTIVLSLFVVYNFLTKREFIEERYSIFINGVAKDPNYLSAFLSFSLVILFYKILNLKVKRLLNFVLFCVVFIGIYLTGSRAALLSCGIAVLIISCDWYIKTKNKKLKFIVTFVFAIVVVIALVLLSSTPLFQRMFSIESYTSDIRLQIWKEGIKAFYASPIIGSGAGASGYYSFIGTKHYIATHNCFLDILGDFGIIGELLILLLLLKMIFISKKSKLVVFAIVVSFFLPLFFVNGFQGLTFWLPMMLLDSISSCCKTRGIKEIFDNK